MKACKQAAHVLQQQQHPLASNILAAPFKHDMLTLHSACLWIR